MPESDLMAEDQVEKNIKDDDAPNPKKRGLGRGLGALFEDDEGVYPQADPEGHTPGAQRHMLGVDQMEPGPFQPRHYMAHESLDELAESIAVHGVLQPILVREKPGMPGQYQIIAGERRWRASQKAQLHEVPVIVKELDDVTALQVALIENLQREDLDPLDEAQGYERLMKEFDYTQEKLATAVGKSRSHIANMVRLLTLPESVQVFIRQGKLTAGHARALVTADNPEELARMIVEQGLSVRDAERFAGGADAPGGSKKSSAKKGNSKAPVKDVDTLALEKEITNVLGMKVTIDLKKAGSGVLKVDFKSLDQLDEIIHRLSHYSDR